MTILYYLYYKFITIINLSEYVNFREPTIVSVRSFEHGPTYRKPRGFFCKNIECNFQGEVYECLMDRVRGSYGLLFFKFSFDPIPL